MNIVLKKYGFVKIFYSNRILFARLPTIYHDVHICLVTIIVIKSKRKCLIIIHVMIKLKIINNINQTNNSNWVIQDEENKSTTQYLLDTTKRKQPQIT